MFSVIAPSLLIALRVVLSPWSSRIAAPLHTAAPGDGRAPVAFASQSALFIRPAGARSPAADGSDGCAWFSPSFPPVTSCAPPARRTRQELSTKSSEEPVREVCLGNRNEKAPWPMPVSLRLLYHPHRDFGQRTLRVWERSSGSPCPAFGIRVGARSFGLSAAKTQNRLLRCIRRSVAADAGEAYGSAGGLLGNVASRASRSSRGALGVGLISKGASSTHWQWSLCGCAGVLVGSVMKWSFITLDHRTVIARVPKPGRVIGTASGRVKPPAQRSTASFRRDRFITGS